MLKIPNRDWKYRAWIDFIISHKEEVFESHKDKMLKIYYIHSTQEAKNNLVQERQSSSQGQFVKILMNYKDPKTYQDKFTEYWMFEKEKGLLMFFTPSTKDGYERTLHNKIERSLGLHEMWIKPTTYKNIRKFLINEKEAGIVKFLADRQKNDDSPQQAREKSGRHILYRASNPLDGINRLNEMEYHLGITAHSIDFLIEDVKMQITDMGLFHLKTLTKKSFELMEEIIDQIVAEEREMRLTAQSIYFNPQKATDSDFILDAGEIMMEKELDSELANQIIKSFTNFRFINHQIAAGSLIFHSDVVDKHKGSVFSIDATDKTITLIPRYRTTFETFLKFYKAVVSSIDDNAKWGMLSGVH